jgi:hypothetical protein
MLLAECVSGPASLDPSTRRPMPAPSSHLLVDSPQPCRRVSVHLVATYPVRWSEFATLRDFLQNFFDAAGAQEFDRAVSILRENDSTLIEMTGDGFALDWLLHMGASTKTGGAPGSTAGYFGEGFKIAALCALRDFAWRVEMASREWSAEVVLAPDKIDGVPVRILSYDVKATNTRPTRTWLRLGHTSGAVHDMLCGAVRCSFCFTGNPLLGNLLYAQHGVSVWARSAVPLPRDLPYRLSGNHPGLLFLAHQARATLPIPFVVSMADDRDHDRDRPSLYDFQMPTSGVGIRLHRYTLHARLRAKEAHGAPGAPKPHQVHTTEYIPLHSALHIARWGTPQPVAYAYAY